MKIIFVFIVSVFGLAASASGCDTLGFKVKVPKVSKIDDRAVGIKITFDTSDRKIEQGIFQRNFQTAALKNEPNKKLLIGIRCPGSYNNEKSLIFLDKKKLQWLNPNKRWKSLTAGIYEIVTFNNQSQIKFTGKLVVL